MTLDCSDECWCKVKQYECLCPCEHETGCIACENGNHDYHIVPPAADAGPRQCAECQHPESEHFGFAAGSFCKMCPQENNVWEHVFRAVPQEAALGACDLWQSPAEDYAVDPHRIPHVKMPDCKHWHVATAPDSAMRVAREVTERLKGLAHEAGNYDGNPKPHCDQCAHDEAAILDAAEALEPHSAALICEAGSERERRLEDALRVAVTVYRDRASGNPKGLALTSEWLAEASRLLG